MKRICAERKPMVVSALEVTAKEAIGLIKANPFVRIDSCDLAVVKNTCEDEIVGYFIGDVDALRFSVFDQWPKEGTSVEFIGAQDFNRDYNTKNCE